MRPGTMICVMCKENDRQKMLKLIFKYTSTLGVRENQMKRYILDRKMEIVNTYYGEIRRKMSSGYGVTKIKYEYEDLERIAKEHNTDIEEVKRRLQND